MSESQLLTAEILPEVGPMQHGIVLNVSEGGLALQFFRTPAVASVGNFRLTLLGLDKPVEAKGSLAWVGRAGCAGVRFTNASSETHSRIREWTRAQPVRSCSQSSPVTTHVSQMGFDFHSALQVIAERARATSGATGAAIAVGDHKYMECRASVGAAPAISAPLSPGTGLSGLCLQTGAIVRCADALWDTRVAAGVAEQLNMRSAVILPAIVSGKIAGILEVFSSEPNAFSTPEVMKRLELLLEFLAVAIEQGRTSDLPKKSAKLSAEAAAPKSVTGSASESSPAGGTVEKILRRAPANFPLPVSKPLLPVTFTMPGLLIVLSVALVSGVLGWHLARRPHQSALPQNETPLLSMASRTEAPVGPPRISFAPSSISEKAGSVFSVDVVLNNAQDASSVSLQILHDPKMLQLAGVAAGELLGLTGTLQHQVDSAGGKVAVKASRPTTPGMSSNGVVCTLVFLARVPGQSKLSVGQVVLQNPAMQLIAAGTSTADVAVAR